MTDETTDIIVVEGEVSLGSLAPIAPEDIVTKAASIATALSSVIEKQGLYKNIQDNKYVTVEGWTTLGAMLGVVPVTVSVDEIFDGVFEATVKLVKVADGTIVGQGIAECGSPDETTKTGKPLWASRSRQARKSMSITRATSKAFRLSFSWIVKIAGYEVTPASEVPPQGFNNNQQQYSTKSIPAPERPWPAEYLQRQFRYKLEKSSMAGTITSGQVTAVRLGMTESGLNDEERYIVLSYIHGREIASTKDLTKAEASIWFKYNEKRDDLNISLRQHEMAAVLRQDAKEKGQLDMFEQSEEGEQVLTVWGEGELGKLGEYAISIGLHSLNDLYSVAELTPAEFVLAYSPEMARELADSIVAGIEDAEHGAGETKWKPEGPSEGDGHNIFTDGHV